MAEIKPDEMNFSGKNICMILEGLPGTWKTSTGLSASKKVILADFDNGMCRVRKDFRKPMLSCSSYDEFLEDVKSIVGKYDTIVIDTCGAMIEAMKEWAVKKEGGCKKDGTISQQGYGIIKREFIRLSNDLLRNFNVVYIFHVEKSKTQDDIFYDLVCEGSAKSIVFQPADLAGMLQIINDKHYIGFTPTAQYNAKSAYGISGLIELPDLKEGEPNVFLEKLFAKVRENLQAEAGDLDPKKAKYKEIMDTYQPLFDGITDIETLKNAVALFKEIPEHALTSEKELKSIMSKKMKELHIGYDKATDTYSYIEEDKK